MWLLSNPSLVLDQLYEFLEAFIQGAALAACFDFYRALRVCLFKRKKPALSVIADIFFWLLATIIFIAAIILRRWGEIHLYTYAGLVLGCFAYFYLLSGYCFRIWLKGMRLLSSALGRFYRFTAGVANATSGPLRKLKGRIGKKKQAAGLNRFWSRILDTLRRNWKNR